MKKHFIEVTEHIAKYKDPSNQVNVKWKTDLYLDKISKTLTNFVSFVHLSNVGISPIKIKACIVCTSLSSLQNRHAQLQ